MVENSNYAKPVGNRSYTKSSVVIVGAGISGKLLFYSLAITLAVNYSSPPLVGICTAIDLIRRHNCRNFVILEKSSYVGGTWGDNRYPGARCDGKCG